MKMLVIGGTGFIGLHLVKALVDAGHEVSVLTTDKKSSESLDFLNNVELVEGSVADFGLVKKLVGGKDWVFNLAAIADKKLIVGIGRKSFEVNCLGELNVLEALRLVNKNANHVFMGSRAQFGRVDKGEALIGENQEKKPFSFYGINKEAAEKYLMYYNDVHGLKAISLRCVSIYGPHLNVERKDGTITEMIKTCLSGGTIQVHNKGGDIKDFLYVDDLTELFMTMVEKKVERGAFNIGSGEEHRFVEIAEKMVETCGGQKEFKELSPVDNLFELGSFVADNTKVTEITGWRPSTTIDEGIRKTKEYYEKNTGGMK